MMCKNRMKHFTNSYQCSFRLLQFNPPLLHHPCYIMFPALTFHLFNLKKYLQYCFLNPRGGAVGSPIMMAFDAFALEYLAPQSVPKTFFPIQIVLFLPEWVPTIARSLFYKLYKITLSKIKKPKNSLFLCLNLQTYNLELLVAFKIAYFHCFTLGGNLENLDFQKSFKTSTMCSFFFLPS